MPLSHRKPRLGPRDGIAILLVILSVAFAVLWLHGGNLRDWVETSGHVVDCQILLTHYNAPDYQPKVEVLYDYTVNGTTLNGRWTGFWPDAGSPDALSPDRLTVLSRKGYPLHVFYLADDPTISRLHDTDDFSRLLFGWLSIGAFALTAAYMVKVYPLLGSRP